MLGKWMQSFVFVNGLIAVLMTASVGLAQPAVDATAPAAEANAPPRPKHSLPSLQEQVDRVQADQTMEEGLRNKLVELYRMAVAESEAAEISVVRLNELQGELDSVESKLKEVNQQLEEPPPKDAPPDPQTDLIQLQTELTKKGAARTEQAQALDLAEVEIARRAERRIEVPASLAKTRQRLAETEAAIAAPRPEDENPLVTEATRTLQQVRLESLQKRIALLDRELPVYDTTARLKIAQRDLAARQLTHLTKAVNRWQEFVNTQRSNEAVANWEKARILADSVDAVLSSEAQDLVALAAELKDVRQELAQLIKMTVLEKQELEQRTRQLETEFLQLTDRAGRTGFTNRVGELLRKHRQNLPDVASLAANNLARQQAISETHLNRLDDQSLRKKAVDIEAEIDQKIESLSGQFTEDQLQAIERDLRQILSLKDELLEGVIQDRSSYLTELTSLETAETVLHAQTRQQAEYIAEHILWVRSTHAVTAEDVSAIWPSLQDFIAKALSSGPVLERDVSRTPIVYLMASLLLLVLLGTRFRLRQLCARPDRPRRRG